MRDFWSMAQLCRWVDTHDVQAVDAVKEDKAPTWPDGPEAYDALERIPALGCQGILTMYGRLRGHGEIQRITAEDWPNLRVVFSEDRGFVAHSQAPFSNQWWTHLMLLSADAQKVWPPRQTSAAATKPPYPEPDNPPLYKVENRETTLVAQAKACLRLMFPDGGVEGSYGELAERIYAAYDKSFSTDTIRRALDKKKS